MGPTEDFQEMFAVRRWDFGVWVRSSNFGCPSAGPPRPPSTGPLFAGPPKKSPFFQSPSFFSLFGRSSRGIVASFQGYRPPKVRGWTLWGYFFASTRRKKRDMLGANVRGPELRGQERGREGRSGPTCTCSSQVQSLNFTFKCGFIV